MQAKTGMPQARDMQPHEDYNRARNAPLDRVIPIGDQVPRPVTAGSTPQPNAPATCNSTTEESRRNELHVPAHLSTGLAVGVSPADHASLEEPSLSPVEAAELQRLNAIDPGHARLAQTGPGFEAMERPAPKTDGSKTAGELPKDDKGEPKADVAPGKPITDKPEGEKVEGDRKAGE